MRPERRGRQEVRIVSVIIDRLSTEDHGIAKNNSFLLAFFYFTGSMETGFYKSIFRRWQGNIISNGNRATQRD